MKKSISGRGPWLACTALCALAAAALRLWQLASAFEGPLSLPIRGAQSSVILTCALVMAAAALLLLAARQPLAKRPWAKGQAHRWDMAFLDRQDKVYPTLLVTAAFLALAAVPHLFLTGLEQFRACRELLAQGGQPTNNGVLQLAAAAATLLAFFGLLQMGRESFRPGRRGIGGFSAALPGVANCVWLMEFFRARASDPVLWDYAPELLAIVLGTFFYLDSAGMSTGAARPRRLLWLAGMTVVFSAVAAVSLPPAGDLLLLGAQALASLAALWRLPPNLENPPAGQDGSLAGPGDEKLEEPTHE